MLDFNKLIEYRKKYPIISGSNDCLMDAIKNNEYDYEYALLTMSIIQKNKEYLFNNFYSDLLVQIPSPFACIGINFVIVHLSKSQPNKFLSGIYKGQVCYKTKKIRPIDAKSSWILSGEYTDEFIKLIENINLFLEGKKIETDDVTLNEYCDFDINNINPLYYTKQAITIRKELEGSDYKLLIDFAELISIPTDKDIIAKYIDSKNFVYPLEYSNIETAELKNAIHVEQGDIICLLIGEKPKFYLYDNNYDDIYIKSGNYCILRCKDKKYSSYIVNYLNDEKARMYMLTQSRGSYIQILSKTDLMNMKVILPTKEMLHIANETQKYIMDQNKLSPYEINELIRKTYQTNYIKESQKMISEDMINLISNMKIKVLQKLISDDLNEVDVCFRNGAYKSAIILCGSILEAVLLDWLSEYENTNDVLDIALNEEGRDLELSKIIIKLKNIVKPYWYESSKAHEIRKTRNMVHPKECIKNNKKVTYEECEIIINYLKDILESKEERHSL